MCIYLYVNRMKGSNFGTVEGMVSISLPKNWKIQGHRVVKGLDLGAWAGSEGPFS